MNIYELEKQSTPGPLRVAAQYTIWDADIETAEGLHVAACTSSPNRSVDSMLNNAVLLVHCRNNFMRALEALKEINDPDMPSHEWKHWLAALPKLIAELEEVKCSN